MMPVLRGTHSALTISAMPARRAGATGRLGELLRSRRAHATGFRVLAGLGDCKTARAYRRRHPSVIGLRGTGYCCGRSDAERLAQATRTLSAFDRSRGSRPLATLGGFCAIEGTRAPDLLARLAPLDFGPSAFPVGSFAQAGIDHVGVLHIHRQAAEAIPKFWCLIRGWIRYGKWTQ